MLWLNPVIAGLYCCGYLSAALGKPALSAPPTYLQVTLNIQFYTQHRSGLYVYVLTTYYSVPTKSENSQTPKMTDPLKSLETASRAEPPSVSKRTYPIAGILTTVFGLDELPSQASDVACLWLLHPRLATQERMTRIAVEAITDWNNRIRDGRTQSVKGLIAVSFDQRNHGTRMVDPLANEAWKQGNARHAQDMFSIFRKCCIP